MKASKPSDPARHCARAARWANAVLLRLAVWIVEMAGLSAPVERAVARLIHPFLNKMAMLICALITVKAMASAAPPKQRRAGGSPSKRASHHMRTLFGSRLRRLARARDPRARIAALAAMLNNLEVHAARMARRLRNGLSRRAVGFKLEPRALPFASLALLSAVHADTS